MKSTSNFIKVLTRVLRIVLVSVLFCCCTLDYDQSSDAQNAVPELVFKDASYKSYEDAKQKSMLKATVLEQYKSTGAFYGKNVEFSTWKKDGSLEANGKCGLFWADTKTNDYSMLDGIDVHDFNRGIQIQAQKIRWNGKTQQLTSGRNDFVTIKREDVEITGMGFCASGISRRFSFEEQVSGKIISKEDEENANADDAGDIENTSETQIMTAGDEQ